MKLEPQEYEDTHFAYPLRNDSFLKTTRKRKADDEAASNSGLENPRQQIETADSDKAQYISRHISDDVMPTLIPIRNSRGFVNSNGPPHKIAPNLGQRQAERSSSDTDVDLLLHLSSHPEIYAHGNNSSPLVEINRKLTTMLANQSKIMSQNEAILSKINSGLGIKSHRIEQLDNILQSKQKSMMSSSLATDLNDDRAERKKDTSNNLRNGRHSSSSLLSSEGGSFSGHNESDITQMSQSKSRRTSDGVSSVGSTRSVSKSPSKEAMLVPSMVPISHCHPSTPATISESSNALPINQGARPMPMHTNPYNMAVYVLRGGEQPHMVPVLPVQYNRPKSGPLQTDVNSSMLSSHPALIYNPDSRQYEASYVTGIAHSNVGPHGEKGDAAVKHNDMTSTVQAKDAVGGNKGERGIHIQPNITNVVSLRRESAEQGNVVPDATAEMKGSQDSSGCGSSAAVPNAACSAPTSPIVIEEDVKPCNLPSQEELMHAQLRSFSMRNYAVQLMRALFRPHEIMHRSVYENGERKGLDRKRLQQIKDYVFQIYPTPNKEKSLAWIECIAAMNEAIRSMK